MGELLGIPNYSKFEAVLLLLGAVGAFLCWSSEVVLVSIQSIYISTQNTINGAPLSDRLSFIQFDKMLFPKATISLVSILGLLIGTVYMGVCLSYGVNAHQPLGPKQRRPQQKTQPRKNVPFYYSSLDLSS